MVCTGFIILKLKSIIGTNDEIVHEQKILDVEAEVIENKQNIILPEYLTQENIIKIHQMSALGFNYFDFIKKAEKVFELFIEAINEDSIEETKSFIDNSIIANIRSFLNQMKQENKKYYIDILRIEKFEIQNINQIESHFTVEIQMITKQQSRIKSDAEEKKELFSSNEILTFKNIDNSLNVWSLSNIKNENY